MLTMDEAKSNVIYQIWYNLIFNFFLKKDKLNDKHIPMKLKIYLQNLSAQVKVKDTLFRVI